VISLLWNYLDPGFPVGLVAGLVAGLLLFSTGFGPLLVVANEITNQH
jgi:hypothetical protein